MSYPGYVSYNSYYGAPQNDETPHGHGSSRSQVPTSSYPEPVAYSTEARQAQYTSQDYSWSAQDPRTYNSSHANPGKYAGDPDRDTTDGQIYDYQGAHASHIGSNKQPAETQAYAASVSHAPEQPSAQAPNKLAYASGPKPSNFQGTAQSRLLQPPQRNGTRNNTALSLPRPQVSKAQQGHSDHSRSPDGAQPTYQTNDQNHLVLQAAAALQGLPKSSGTKAGSTALGSLPPAMAPSRQRSQSLYTTTKDAVPHQHNQSSQSVSNQLPTDASRTSTTHTTVNFLSTRSQQSYRATHNEATPASVPKTNDITSSVTNTDRQEIPAYPSPTEDPVSTTFINPREVFNPYHREHERVRREAAAAAIEAAAKRDTIEDNLKPKDPPAAGPTAKTRQNNAYADPSTTVAKPKSNSAAKMKISGSASAEETDQAAELRQLLARMKELRGKDAALFQRVWDEEKGASAAKARSASPMASLQILPPSAQVATQTTKTAQRPPVVSRQRDDDLQRGFNGYTVVIEDNAEGLPDLGKFPAARRVRYSYSSRKQQQSPANTSQQKLPPMPASAPAPVTDTVAQSDRFVLYPNVAPDSVPAVQPLPARGKDDPTVWPEAYRRVLAAQAIQFLKSDPRHESLSISETEVIGILEGNPSYIALCQVIEARGFIFDRAQLARSLITNVPSLSTSNRESQPPLRPHLAPAQTRSYPPSAATATVNPPAANHAPPFMNGRFIKPETPLQRFRGATPLMHQGKTLLAAHLRSRRSVPAAPVPVQTPGSKEEMARKRGFEDLIDLTNEGDEDYVVPEKRPRLRSSSPDPIAAFAQQTQALSKPKSSFVRFASPTPQGMLPKAVTPLRFNTHVPGFLREEPKQARPPKIMLAKKLNKVEALRRNYYDPKTIARDILISAGRHPTERPLNGHLAGLLGNHIELESDLSTFHWEDVDPGGPPASKIAWVDIPAGPPRFKSQLSKSSKTEVLAKVDSVDPSYKAQQNLSFGQPLGRLMPDHTQGAASRRPATANKDSGRFGSGNFVRVQECQESLPKSGQMPRSLASSKPRDSSPHAARRAEQGLRIFAQQTKSLFNNSFKPPQRHPSGLRHSQATASDVGTLSSRTPPTKRGPSRPQRESNLPESSLPLPIETSLRKGPGRLPRTIASPQVQSSPPRPTSSVSYSQRSVSVEVPKIKGSLWPSGNPKGRPSGSKNNITPDERKIGAMSVQVVVPRLHAEDDPPEYPIFKCRWVKCSAELHNISTLRKHIAKLHKPVQDNVNEVVYGCYWKKCSLLRKDEDGNSEPTPIATEEEWLDHINEEHINRLGRKHGDGPSTQHIGSRL